MIMVASFFTQLLNYISKRPFKFDPDIGTAGVLIPVMELSSGFLRGVLLTRRKLVLGRGAKITNLRSLYLNGGLVRIGEYCRLECTSHEGINLGQNFKLGAFSQIIASGTLTDLGKGVNIGHNVGIGEFSYIGGAGGTRIGDDTIIGQYFSAHPENHVFSDGSLPIRKQGTTREGIVVGSGCWIGAKVTLTDGITIGGNSVIGAGSVVTKSFPKNSVIGGIPARLLRTIDIEDI